MLFKKNYFSLQFTEILFVKNYKTLLMNSDQKRKTQNECQTYKERTSRFGNHKKYTKTRKTKCEE